MFFLGEKLGKTVGELMDMPNSEFVMWCMYYSKQAQAKELAQKAGR